MKTCFTCKIPKPLTDFNRQSSARDGYKAVCRVCDRARQARYARKRGIPQQKKRTRDTDTHRECMRCRDMFPRDQFSRCPRGADGLSAYCRGCMVRVVMQDKEKHAANTRNWRKRNPEKHLPAHRAHQHKRRMKTTEQDTGTVTGSVILALLKKETCEYCRKPVPMDQRTVDHVIPLDRDGLHDALNLVMACSTCNSSKSNKTGDEYRAKLQSESVS